MDPRLRFLRASIAGPITTTFEHRGAHGARGLSGIKYFPPKRGVEQAPQNFFLFILGNPGILEYYDVFLSDLQDRLPESYAFLVTSHIGGQPGVEAPVQPLDLKSQLDAKVELAHALVKSLSAWQKETNWSSDPPRLGIIGHSVGAWLANEVMQRVPSIHLAYLLFPTLGWIADSWNGWKLRPIFHKPLRHLLPKLAPHVVPIAPWAGAVSGQGAEPTLSLLRSPTTLQNVLSLARSEMETIREPNWAWYEAQGRQPHGRGIYGIYSAGNLDGWVGKEGPMIRRLLGENRVALLKDVPHAFCLRDSHCKLVADVLATWMLHSPDEPVDEIDSMI